MLYMHCLADHKTQPALQLHAARLTSAAPAMTQAALCIAYLLSQLLRSRVLLRRSNAGGGRRGLCATCNTLHRMHLSQAHAS